MKRHKARRTSVAALRPNAPLGGLALPPALPGALVGPRVEWLEGRWMLSETAVLSGVVWADLNADGVRDAGEAGVPGVEVYIDADNDAVLDWADANFNEVWDAGEGERWMESAADGSYVFDGLAAGDYVVRQVVPAGLQATGPLGPVQQTAKLTATPAVSAWAFGSEVSLDGDVAVVGADSSGGDGAAYVFRRSGPAWTQEARLLPADGVAGSGFGSSADVDGQVAVVGARLDDDKGTDSGSVYVFRWNGSTWAQEAKLTASDGAANEGFGWSVGVDGDSITVGAPWAAGGGAAYVFQRTGGTWTQHSKLTADDRYQGDFFGGSVSIDQGAVLVGAPYDNVGGPYGPNQNSWHGAGYVFRFDGAAWTQEAKLIALDHSAFDELGGDVALSGDTAVLGAFRDLNGGSAYVFRREGGVWTQESKLRAPDGEPHHHFGQSVDTDGERVLIGAYGTDKRNGGYLYEHDSGGWLLRSAFRPATLPTGTDFGTAVAIDGQRLFIGAPRDGNGSAYVFGIEDRAHRVTLADEAQRNDLNFGLNRVPRMPNITDASDTGRLVGDRVTRLNNTPGKTLSYEVFGTRPGDTVRLFADGVLVGTAIGAAQKTIVTTDGVATLADGWRSITSRIEDAYGNWGPSLPENVNIDTVAPIITVTPKTTTDTTPSLAGTVNSWAAVTVTVNGQAYTAQVSSPAWTIADNVIRTLPGGVHNVVATATDDAGNVGADTTTNELTIDTAAPAPAAPDLTAGTDSGLSETDDLTNDSTPTFTGSALAGATVTIYADGAAVGTGVATGGVYSITTSALADGVRSITARQALSPLTQSPDSPSLSVTIDTAAPGAPGGAGTLDTSFGGTGVVTAPYAGADTGMASAVQADGKVLVVGANGSGFTGGTLVLTRFNPDGSLDTGFGSGGRVLMSEQLGVYGLAVAVQGDGKIVVGGELQVPTTGGSYSGRLLLLRYNPDGSPDTTFGGSGRFVGGPTPDVRKAEALAIQPDGKILAAGMAFNAAGSSVFGVARFHTNGTRDTTFGSGGLSYTEISASTDIAEEVALLPDGRIVLSGAAHDAAAGITDVGVVVLKPDGSLDTSFNGDGIAIGRVTAVANLGVSVNAMEVLPDGSTLVSGSMRYSTGFTDGVILKFTPGGQLDTTFAGGTGTFMTEFNITGSNYAGVSGLAIQPDGRIIGVGGTAPATLNTPAMLRLLPNGTVDTSFGVNGYLNNLGSATGTLTSAALLPGGKLVAGGGLTVGADSDHGAVRINVDAPIDLQAASDTGGSNTDNITADNTPTFSISAGPYFRVYRGATLISGSFETGSTFTPATQPDGSYAYTVAAVDAAGNESTKSASVVATIDTAAPVVTVTSKTTTDPTPALSGTVSEAVASLTVTVNGRTYTPTISGTTWTLADNAVAALPFGIHDVVVTATDAAGNSGADATTGELTLVPYTPQAPDLLPVSDSGASNTDNITRNNSANSQAPLWFSVIGLGSDQGLVELVTADGTVVASGAPTASTSTATILAPTGVVWADGSHTIYARHTINGVRSANSGPLTITIDGTAPVPTFTPVATSDMSPPLSGGANEAILAVTVTVGGQTVTGSGAWAVADNRFWPPLNVGTYDVTVALTDPAGNTGSTTFANALTITPGDPGLPDLSSASDTGYTSNDNVTRLNNGSQVSRLTFDVPATPIGALVELFTSDGSLLGSAVATSTVTPVTTNGTRTLADGVHGVYARYTYDGVVSGNSPPLTVTVDTVAPVLTVTSLTTSDTTPPITGTANEMLGEARVRVNGTQYTVEKITGSWRLNDNVISPPLAMGAYDVVLTAADLAGNFATDSTTNELTVTHPAPATPDLLAESDTGSSGTDNLTRLNNASEAARLTFSVGNTVSGALVELFTGAGVLIGSAVASGTTTTVVTNGTTALPDGSNAVYARQTAAGLAGPNSTSVTIQIDTVAPVVSVTPKTTADATPSLVGTSNETLGNVSVTVGGNSYAATVGTLTWSLGDNVIAPPLAPGVYDVTVTGTDRAGNIGTDTATGELTVLPSAPATPDLAPESDTGSSATDNLTRLNNASAAATLTFTVGNTIPGALVQLYTSGDVLIGSAIAPAGTSTTVTTSGTTLLGEGAQAVYARQTVGGAASANSVALALTVDTVAPTVTVTALSTADATPPLSGSTSEALGLLSVTVAGQTLAGSTGSPSSWSLADNTLAPLAIGVYEVALQATDLAGNTGSDTSTNELTITINAPAAPDLAAASDTGVSSTDNFTRFNNGSAVTALAFTVANTVEGALVELFTTGGVLLGSATAPAGGVTTITTNGSAALADGSRAIYARQTLGGAVSGNSASLAVTVDTAAPVVSVTTKSTTDVTPSLLGSANEVLGAATVTVNGQSYAASVVENTWSLADNTVAALTPGVYDVAVQATDRAGNTGSDTSTNELTIQLGAPSTPDLLPEADTGSSSTDNITKLNNASPATALTFSVGNTIPGALVELLASTTVIGSATATGAVTTVTTDGSTALANGVHSLVARQTYGGLTSATQQQLNLTVDTAAPTVTVTAKTTDDATPALAGGVSEQLATVQVTINGQTYAATVSGLSWSIADNVIAALPAGTYDVLATATDRAGNVATDATAEELTVITAAGEIRGVKWHDLDADGQNDAGEPLLTGWTVYLDVDNDRQLDAGEPTALTDASGAYTFTGLPAGRYYVREVLQPGWRQTAPRAGGAAGSGGGLLEPITFTGSSAPVSLLADPVIGGGGFVIETAQSGPLINLDDFRADTRFNGYNGAGFSVAVLDSGIDLNHPFFGPDTNGDGVADRILYDYDFYGNDTDASDGNGHGSNVASIIGSSDATYGGMAPGVGIIALQVLSSSGSGTFSDTEEALQWLVANAATYNIAAINMSLGDSGNYTSNQSLYGLSDELAALKAMGVIVVSAAGNSFYNFGSAQGIAYPAADASSLAVGAVYDSSAGSFSYSSGAVAYSSGPDRVAPFSQRHATMTEIFAPGAPITGANYNGSTVTMHGTSQAAPHIAGIAALAQDMATDLLGRKLTQDEFINLLRTTATSVIDGDNEDDNVTNTGLSFPRVDVYAMAQAIYAMAGPIGYTVDLAAGQAVTDRDFGNRRETAAPDLVAADDSGVSSTDNITQRNNTNHTLRFDVPHTVAGDVVRLFADGVEIGQTVATGATTRVATNGTSTLADGARSFTARIDSAAVGNAAVSTPLSVIVDTTVPTVTVATKSTTDTTPSLFGTASETLGYVSVRVNGVTYQATVSGNTWSLADNTISPPLTPGVYDVVVQAQDLAANAGADTTTNELTILLAAPSTPDLLATSDTGSSSTDNVTRLNNATAAAALSFSVANTIPGALVELLTTGNVVIGSATATGTTTTVVTNGSTALANGVAAIFARQTYNGAPSANSGSLSITVDTAAPTVTVTAKTTSDSTPSLSGSASETLGSAQVTVNGSTYTGSVSGATWSLADNAITPGLSLGTYDVAVTVSDIAGNTASDTTTNELTVTLGATSTPDLLAASDTGSSTTDNITRYNNATPATALSFSIGNTLVGALVELFTTGDVLLGSATATSGTTTITTNGSTAWADGTRSVYARQTASGSTSLNSSSLSVTIDTVAPTVSVTSKSTSDTTPSLSGTANETVGSPGTELEFAL